MKNSIIERPKGKLGVLIVGINGAVSTTFLAGVTAIRKNKARPIGSLTQMATIRIGNRAENNFPLIKDFVPLAELGDLVFGGWDIRKENSYEAAKYAKVLNDKDLEDVREELEAINPMPAVFEKKYVKRLDGDWVKKGANKYELMEQLRDDIRSFKKANDLDRLLMIWCGSTEIFLQPSDVHATPESFEKGMKENDENISPSMLYAYAAISEKIPFINGAPNLTIDIPALEALALLNEIPIAGKDFKTGQTMLKTVITPMLKARMLGLKGWFSSNILGNRDGEVLDDYDSFRTKEESKLSVIDSILQPDLYQELYKDYYHKVRINYYPPANDNKESWDNIDIFGWLNYPMQLKVNFLCRDSILAAPIVLDLILLTDLAERANMSGIQEWLSFYFKSPMHAKGIVPENDLFIQMMKMKNTLRKLMGYKPITHLDTNDIEVLMEQLDEAE
ncbi:MAG: inositol-3-phosphate synthase [Ignavibacteria bacterium]|jgi:myo-inositol-1-phosphate synthase